LNGIVPIFIIVRLVLHSFDGKLFLDLIKVIKEVMLFIFLRLIWNRADFPVFFDGLPPCIKLYEFLEPVISASKSIDEPIDALPLDDKTHK